VRTTRGELIHHLINSLLRGAKQTATHTLCSWHSPFQFFNKPVPFCDARLYHIVNTITWLLLYPHLQDNQILRKTVPVTWAMGSYIVPETIKIRLCWGVNDTCNGHYGHLSPKHQMYDEDCATNAFSFSFRLIIIE